MSGEGRRGGRNGVCFPNLSTEFIRIQLAEISESNHIEISRTTQRLKNTVEGGRASSPKKNRKCNSRNSAKDATNTADARRKTTRRTRQLCTQDKFLRDPKPYLQLVLSRFSFRGGIWAVSRTLYVSMPLEGVQRWPMRAAKLLHTQGSYGRRTNSCVTPSHICSWSCRDFRSGAVYGLYLGPCMYACLWKGCRGSRCAPQNHSAHTAAMDAGQILA